MTTISQSLRSAFDEFAAQSESFDPARTIGAVRRRRVAYAAGTGTAAAVAVGAVAFGAVNLPSAWNQSPATQGVVCTDDPFGLANSKAFGALEYKGRSFIDPANDVYLFIHADGTREELVQDPDGAYTAIIDGEPEMVWVGDWPRPAGLTHSDWVRDSNGLQGLGYAVFPGADAARDTWPWTMDVPVDAPEGLDLDRVSWVLLGAAVGVGQQFTAGDVPLGATVELIARGDGTDVTLPLGPGESGPGADQFGDAAKSIELRVTMDDGSTYTATAHHDPDARAPQLCVMPTPSATAEPSPDATEPTPEPQASAAPGVVFTGPESVAVQCGAPLRPDDEGTLGFDIEWVTGERELKRVPEAVVYDTYDFGEGGILAGAVVEDRLSEEQPMLARNWQGVWNAEGDKVRGVSVFSSPLWLVDGVVVGYGLDGGLEGDSRTTHFNPIGDEATHVWLMYGDVDTERVPCDGVDASALDGAELVFLVGTGPVAGPYEFGWTRIDR